MSSLITGDRCAKLPVSGEGAAVERENGHIGSLRAVLCLLVVGGAALGALLLRPGGGLLAEGRGPLGGNPVLVLGLALLSLLGGIALRAKYVEQIGAQETLDPVEMRLVDGVRRVLTAAPLALPLLIVALHRFGASDGDSDGGAPADGGAPGSSSLPPAPSVPVPGAPPAPAAAPDDGGHSTLTRILLVLGLALLTAALVLAVRRLWRHPSLPTEPEAEAVAATPGSERAHLADAVDSGRRALQDGTDVRAAVIACYLAMEESLADSGVARHASDSPHDLLERALDGGLPAAEAATELTALFREARYSTHPMHGGHRDRATAALAEIANGLRSQAHGPRAGAVAG
ncbi:DUF4129 domain-containing protein [Streptomyces racemochromogenes]|uniref:DUF4129 domain-containing protein n=1 Tax=Streptomyces racemochromogenes TaxID=67353 RepID=A0ABW7PG36_9ACTN